MKFFSRPTELKFCYEKRSCANRAFNVLMEFFVKHRADYRVLKSKIYDCSPYDSVDFEWCVYFKFIDTDKQVSKTPDKNSDISGFIEKARQDGLL